MDFSVFPTIKKQLKWSKFKSLSGLRVAVKTILSQFDEKWYENMFDRGYSATADAFCTVGSTLRRSEILYLRQRDPAKQMTSATSPCDACRAPRRRRVLAWMNDIFLLLHVRIVWNLHREKKKNSRFMSYNFCFSVLKEFPVRAKVHVIFEQPSYVQVDTLFLIRPTTCWKYCIFNIVYMDHAKMNIFARNRTLSHMRTNEAWISKRYCAPFIVYIYICPYSRKQVMGLHANGWGFDQIA